MNSNMPGITSISEVKLPVSLCHRIKDADDRWAELSKPFGQNPR